MKVIIIEGPDNSGKNTLIHWIIEHYNNVKIVHCDRPKSKDNPFLEQKQTFLKLANDAIIDNIKNNVDVLVFNRYYQGEYVYGQMYRNGNAEEILKMIHNLESYLKNNIGDDNIFYVQLASKSSKLLQKNDDGKSLSNNDYEKICQEQNLFREVFDKSTLKNKRKIFINKKRDWENFRSRSEILHDFIDFVSPSERV